MKKVFILIAMVVTGTVAGIYTWQGQEATSISEHVPLTTLKTEADSVELGLFRYAETKKAVFRFRNTGNNPLIIKNVISSCGCTDIRWNKKPILPGKPDSVVVYFTPNSLGQFNKSAEVICNTLSRQHFLYLSGFVEE